MNFYAIYTNTHTHTHKERKRERERIKIHEDEMNHPIYYMSNFFRPFIKIKSAHKKHIFIYYNVCVCYFNYYKLYSHKIYYFGIITVTMMMTINY